MAPTAEQLRGFFDAYVVQQARIGSQGTYASAQFAIDKWLERGYHIDAAIRRVRARSPLNTLQEQQVGLPHEEWRILVVCSLLNMTHGRQVRPMISQLFARAPSPEQFVAWQAEDGGRNELRTLIKPLGFSSRRARSLTRMSEEFATRGLPPADAISAAWASRLPGVGPYALDSLEIFRYDRLVTTTSDTWLNEYVAWRTSHAK